MNTSKAVTVSAVMGKISSIVGYTVGVPSLFIIFLGLTDLESPGAADAVIISLIVLVPCVFFIYKGIQIKKRINRFKKYDSIILANITSLEYIAARTYQPVNFVRTDLQKMIDKNFFASAHIDMSTNEIVINGRSPAAARQEQEPLQKSQTGGEMETVSNFVGGALNANCIEYKVTKEDYINAIKHDLKKPILLAGILSYLAFYGISFVFILVLLLLHFLDAPAQMIVLAVIALPISVVLLAILFSRRSRAARVVKSRLERGELDLQYFDHHRLELKEDGIEQQYGTICARRAYAGIQKIVEYPNGIMVYNSQLDMDIVPSSAFWDAQQRGAFLNNLQGRISRAKSAGVSKKSSEEHKQDTSFVLEYTWDEPSFFAAMKKVGRMIFTTRLGWPTGQIVLTLVGFILCLAGIPSLMRLFTGTMEMREFYSHIMTLLPGLLCFGFGVAFLSPLIVTFTPLAENIYRRQIDNGTILRDYFSPQKLCLKEDRITELRSMSSYDVLYDMVYCVRYDDNCMYILLKGRRFFAIPSSAFPSDDRKREIADYIEKRSKGKA